MNEPTNELQWNNYIETPCRVSAPVKIDDILAKRLKEFKKARKQYLKQCAKLGV